MIAHLVLFKLKPAVSKTGARLTAVIAGTHALPEQIASIRGWEHGPNQTQDSQAWDYGLRALFDNEHGVRAYFEDAQHLLVLRQWEAICDLAFCDYVL